MEIPAAEPVLLTARALDKRHDMLAVSRDEDVRVGALFLTPQYFPALIGWHQSRPEVDAPFAGAAFDNLAPGRRQYLPPQRLLMRLVHAGPENTPVLHPMLLEDSDRGLQQPRAREHLLNELQQLLRTQAARVGKTAASITAWRRHPQVIDDIEVCARAVLALDQVRQGRFKLADGTFLAAPLTPLPETLHKLELLQRLAALARGAPAPEDLRPARAILVEFDPAFVWNPHVYGQRTEEEIHPLAEVLRVLPRDHGYQCIQAAHPVTPLGAPLDWKAVPPLRSWPDLGPRQRPAEEEEDEFFL